MVTPSKPERGSLMNWPGAGVYSYMRSGALCEAAVAARRYVPSSAQHTTLTEAEPRAPAASVTVTETLHSPCASGVKGKMAPSAVRASSATGFPSMLHS